MRNTSSTRPYVYVSGALSGLDAEELARVTEIYDLIADASRSAGLAAYRPHLSPTAPGRPMEPGEVWLTDFARVTNAELLVAYVGIPSLGVGSEIEMARHAGVRVILVTESQRVGQVSRLVLGSPAVSRVVVFENHYQLRHGVADAMRSLTLVEQSPAPTSSLERLTNEVVTAARRRVRRNAISTSGQPEKDRRRRSA